VQAQSAVVALDGGNIRAYSTAGTPMWNYSARGRISPYVSRSKEGTSYFSRTNGTLIAVNRAGRELWRRNIESPLIARVIPGWDGRLFVPVDKKIFCFTASGTLLWTRIFESPFSIPPKLDRSGNIIFALENNAVCRIDPFGNYQIRMVSEKPSVLVSVDSGRLMALYPNGTMEIIGAAEDWFMSAQGEVHSVILPRLPASPLTAVSIGDNVSTVMSDGRIAFVSINERKVVWTGDSHIRELIRNGSRPDLETEMIFDERGIYVLSKNGATGFSHDGRRYWYMFLQNAAAVPAFGDDGVLYSGGRDWILYSYKLEDRILPVRGGIYGQSADGSYRMGNPNAAYFPNAPLFENEIRAKLAQIDSAIAAGRVGENEPAWMTFLLTLSTSQEHMQLRLNAIHLLGRLGSRETIPWLTDIFRKESEPLLRAGASLAIGAIGVDPDGTAIQAFVSAITHSTLRDEQVLVALISATGALCRFSGPPLSETGVRILNLLSANNQPALVRQHAQRELVSLR
jgi:outer membrane protein assembly factor BamB